MITNQDCRHRHFPYFVMVAAVVVAMAPCGKAQEEAEESAPAPVAMSAAPSQEEVQTSIRTDINKESIRRDELEIKADETVRAAREAYAAEEYQIAVDKYLEAISLLEKCGSATHVKEKNQRIRELIAQVYHSWAEDKARQAETDANAGEIDEAIKKCVEAIRMDPSMELRMQDLIAKFEKQKKVIIYRGDTSEQLIDPGKEERLYRVDLLYAQGKKLYAEKQWDKARDKFEEILSLNPYNLKAIEYARKINHQMYAVGKVRYETTREERVAESEWKFVTPLLPRAESGLKEIEQQPLRRDEGGDVIQRKLREIILDHIEFEEVTIPTVVKHLKQRSRELDPEKKGVNIFLRLGGGQATQAGPSATDDLFSGDEEDLFGGDAEADADTEDADGEAGGGGFGGGNDGVPTITIVVDDIPLGEAIRYICRGANLKYRIEKHAVVIASQDVALDELETRIYPVEQESMTEIGGDEGGEGGEGGTSSMVRYFSQRGVAFPEGARAVYDPRISRLIATNTPENLAKIEDVIRELNVVDPQVLIECKFVEVQTNKLNNLGFEWRIGRPVGDSAKSTTFDPNDPLMRFNTDLAWTNNDRVFRITHRDSQLVSWEAIVHALDLRDTTDILSTPRITTQNGEEATIRMATEVYFPESWGEAQFVSVSGISDYFVPSQPEFGEPTELGVRLTVTPNVDADRYTISMDMVPIIQAHIGWLDYSYNLTVNGVPLANTLRMPIIEARQIETRFNVYDGETVVIGGVIRDTTTEIDDRIPALGDIPLLGRLFRSKVHDAAKANLLIFTTVRLVNPDGSPLREREVRGKPPFRQ
jgi:general secretion pathway protein D